MEWFNWFGLGWFLKCAEVNVHFGLYRVGNKTSKTQLSSLMLLTMRFPSQSFFFMTFRPESDYFICIQYVCTHNDKWADDKVTGGVTYYDFQIN